MSLLNSSKLRTLMTASFVLGSATFAYADIKQGLTELDAKNYEAAAQTFSKAFEDGEVDGAFYLGRMLELGLGGEPNRQTAVGLYVAGSAKGSALAKNRLGVLHVQGLGVLQDYERGATLVCEAAEAGDMNGQFNCGSLLKEGKGIAKDEKKAVEWFGKAADSGHVGAKNLYAEALVQGVHVEQNPVKAVQYYQQTAASGNATGLFSLALAFENGLGLEKDVEKAHAYFNLASALNHPLAAQARARVEQSMTSEQVTNAQRFAKAWRPAPAEKKNVTEN